MSGLGSKGIVVVGASGKVGTEFLQAYTKREPDLAHSVPLVGLAGRSHFLIDRDVGSRVEEIMPTDTLDGDRARVQDEMKRVIAGAYLSVVNHGENLEEVLKGLLEDGYTVVDVTDAGDTMQASYQHLADTRGAMAVANKRHLVGDQCLFDDLKWVRDRGRFGALATLMAGTGNALNRVSEIDFSTLEEMNGVFSGTLNYLCSRMEEGVPFSQALKEARDLGCTEPDPREDLQGADVARKALNVARTLGLSLDLIDIEVEPFISPDYMDGDAESFLEGITSSGVDEEMAEKFVQAGEKNETYRYVARLRFVRGAPMVKVGLELVSGSSEIGRLRGTDNMIEIIDNTGDHVLLKKGPGAGPRITAEAVLRDVKHILTGQEVFA